MPRLRSPLLLLLLLPACGRTHLLVEGRYALTATEVLRDDCGLLAQPADLWDGALRVSGNVVWMDYELLQPPMVLSGTYLHGVERFTVDGTASNVHFPVRGRDCVVDRVAVSLLADTDEAAGPVGTAFTGTVRVSVTTRDEADAAACTCELEATLRAVHETNSPAAAP